MPLPTGVNARRSTTNPPRDTSRAKRGTSAATANRSAREPLRPGLSSNALEMTSLVNEEEERPPNIVAMHGRPRRSIRFDPNGRDEHDAGIDRAAAAFISGLRRCATVGPKQLSAPRGVEHSKEPTFTPSANRPSFMGIFPQSASRPLAVLIGYLFRGCLK